MPYIKKEVREAVIGHGYDFKGLIDTVINHLRTIGIQDREGLVNYAISRIVAGSLKPQTGWRYSALNHAHGTFFSAAAEFYRRLMVRAENNAIENNGDIPEYETF